MGHHRICLVIDIDTTDTNHALTNNANQWLNTICHHIANHTTTAHAVRYDIDGSPHLTPPQPT